MVKFEQTCRSDYVYANYDEHPDPSHRPMYLKRVVRCLRDHGSITTILDAGCGGGDFAEGMYKEGFGVFGIDLSESAVRAAQERACGVFKVGSIYDDLCAPFGLKAFDAVVAVETIEHLYSPRLFVKRVNDALRPNGIFIVTTPYWGYFKNIALAVTNRTDSALTALWEGGHIKHWSRRTLTELMTEQRFELIAFEGCGKGVRDWVP